MSDAIQLKEVRSNCYHAVRNNETLFVVWPYPGGKPKYGANHQGKADCVATADSLREMAQRLQVLANDIL